MTGRRRAIGLVWRFDEFGWKHLGLDFGKENKIGLMLRGLLAGDSTLQDLPSKTPRVGHPPEFFVAEMNAQFRKWRKSVRAGVVFGRGH